KPFFTSHGSFWTNSTSALLAGTSEADRQAPTRNRCHGEGYESVVLIPLRADHQTFGLLQFNDRRVNRFTPPLIAHFERMADSLAIALSRRQTEQALQESEKNLRMAQQLSKIGSWQWSLDTHTIRWSKELCRINGHNPDLPAPSFEEMSSFYTPRDWKRLNKAVRKALSHGESYELELDLIRTDGVVIQTMTRGEADYDTGGGITGLHGTVQDITEQKRAEEERARLEAQNQQLLKTESLHRMAGAIAHQFNNLLGAILGNLELLEMEIPPGSEDQEYLTEAMKASRRASELSGRMLAYLGQTVGRHEMLNLSETCRAYLPPLRSFLPKNIGLEPDLQLPGPIICANSAQILQILSNLITNAWEAIGSDVGTIHLAIQTVPSEAISASQRFPPNWSAEHADYACLEVRDTGCGIPKEDIEKLFDPFFTTKFVGRGLGLPVVLGLVRAHEGGIRVESQPGRGSIFRIYLPLSRA
ncbi:MAG: ATP-binding protein, partial [Syntrophales bacterium LBB04]|nr:ATP-binding protein [Syntrophales bacterium LBB04]